MDCHQPKHMKDGHGGKRKILLMGNPNVGKSVIFSRLTGLEVITANYTGTTVSYYEGVIRYQGAEARLIDVPGVYSLEATSKAEEVALSMLDEGADLIICVLDATHLARNLTLALSLRQRNLPIIYALNLSDVAKRRGLSIDIDALSTYLKAPVIETVAVKRQGMTELKSAAFSEVSIPTSISIESCEDEADLIAEAVIKTHAVKPSGLEKLGDYAMRPLTGIPIAFLVLALAMGIVVGGGKLLRSYILLPLVNEIVVPFIVSIVDRIVSPGLFYNLLVGEYGVLVKGIEWPFALILPYVLLFYIVFSFLEDSGYLPRLGVLMDGIFRKIGLPGSNIIPFIMGYGCAVPAILGTRAASSHKERVITVTLIAIAVPCTAQTGAFITLLGDRSIFALLFVYMMSFFMIIVAGVLLNRLIKGPTRPLILEIPNLLMPDLRSLSRKIWMRLKHFLVEAEIPMMLGILLAALLVETDALIAIGRAMEPIVEGWLGLPREASLSLMLGIIRRELAVMPLIEMNLTTVQIITGSIVALFYLPCISVFGVLIKEFKLKVALLISASTIVVALLMGGLVRFFLELFM